MRAVIPDKKMAIRTSERDRAMAPRKWTVGDLPELRMHLADTLDNHLRNLTRTYGSFVGMNAAVRRLGETGDGISGVGTGTINTVLLDQIQLLAIRAHALTSEPTRKTDITLQTFRSALANPEIRTSIVSNVASWPGTFPINRDLIERRIDKIEQRFKRLEKVDPETLKTFRDKVLAHVTTEANDIKNPMNGHVWRMVRISISIAHNLHAVFAGHVPGYFHEGHFAREDGRKLIELLKANQQAID